MTLSDLLATVAGVALVIVMPSRAAAWPFYLGQPPLFALVVIGGLGLAVSAGLVLALVVLTRRGRYGGPVRAAERLALGLASLALLGGPPNLDEAVNAYYVAAGSASLDFGVARWLLATPAAAGVALVVVGLVLVQRGAREGSKVAPTLTVIGIVVGLILWFWGPCEVARLELPYVLVPGLRADPLSWGWRPQVAVALRGAVADAPTTVTWAFLATLAVRRWWDGRRHGPPWVWTEAAASVAALMAALLYTVPNLQGPSGLLRLLSFIALVGLMSWWLASRLRAIGEGPARRSGLNRHRREITR
jgi:hypothetical protein